MCINTGLFPGGKVGSPRFPCAFWHVLFDRSVGPLSQPGIRTPGRPNDYMMVGPLSQPGIRTPGRPREGCVTAICAGTFVLEHGIQLSHRRTCVIPGGKAGSPRFPATGVQGHVLARVIPGGKAGSPRFPAAAGLAAGTVEVPAQDTNIVVYKYSNWWYQVLFV